MLHRLCALTLTLVALAFGLPGSNSVAESSVHDNPGSSVPLHQRGTSLQRGKEFAVHKATVTA